MLRMLRALWCSSLSLVAACGRSDPPPRPSQPTLVRAPDPGAPASGRRVVAVGQIAQAWHAGAWSPASITLSDVAAGDVIVALGVYWGDLPAGASTAPLDERAAPDGAPGAHGPAAAATRVPLGAVIDQGPAIVGRRKPPVFAQVHAVLDPAPGAHTIVPPYLGGPAGDGTFYVVQLRGLTERRVIASGQTRVTGSAIAEVSVALDGAAQPGDLVLAIGGYDNTAPRERAGFRPPAAGWLGLGVQEDAASNVPSELCGRVAADAGPSPVTWAWTDPTANVAAAAIAALR